MYQLRRYFSCYILHRNKPKNIIVIMCKRTRKRSNHPSISYIIIWTCKCEILLQLCLEGIFTIYTIQFCASIPNCMCVLTITICSLYSAKCNSARLRSDCFDYHSRQPFGLPWTCPFLVWLKHSICQCERLHLNIFLLGSLLHPRG